MEVLGISIPNINIVHSKVGSLTISIPGGALSWLVSRSAPITITVEDLHILVDKKVLAPGEAVLKLEAAKRSALDVE